MKKNNPEIALTVLYVDVDVKIICKHYEIHFFAYELIKQLHVSNNYYKKKKSEDRRRNILGSEGDSKLLW